MFVADAIALLVQHCRFSRFWARAIICAAVWLVVGRYQIWRLFVTILPANGTWHEVGWVWFCYEWNFRDM